MSEYSDPVKVLRQHVKEQMWQAEKLSRDARDLELRAGTLRSAAIDVDLIADKIEKALTALAPTS